MATETCTVSFTGPSDIGHSVEVTAESLYEAAALGLSLLRKAEWTEPIASGAQLEVVVREPATIHAVPIRHLFAWLEQVETPAEMSRKGNLKVTRQRSRAVD
jgi:hypothetical protein